MFRAFSWCCSWLQNSVIARSCLVYFEWKIAAQLFEDIKVGSWSSSRFITATYIDRRSLLVRSAAFCVFGALFAFFHSIVVIYVVIFCPLRLSYSFEYLRHNSFFIFLAHIRLPLCYSPSLIHSSISVLYRFTKLLFRGFPPAGLWNQNLQNRHDATVSGQI